MEQTLEEFIQALRKSDVKVSVAEALDAYEVADFVGLEDRTMLKDALSFALTKNKYEKEIYDAAFDRFFQVPDFHSLQQESEQSSSGSCPLSQAEKFDDPFIQMLLQRDSVGLQTQLLSASRRADLSDIWLSSQKGVFIQKIMREMGVEKLQQAVKQAEVGEKGYTEEDVVQLREAQRFLTKQVRSFVEEQFELYAPAATKQLREEQLKDIILTDAEERDYLQMQQIVKRMADELSSLYSKRRKKAQRGKLDIRKTMRRNMSNDGVLFDIHWKQKKIDRPKIIAICDVSGSVRDYTRFMLLFLHSLHEVFDDLHTYVFCSNLVEVTEEFENNTVQEAIRRAQMKVQYGSTDYARALSDLKEQHLDHIDKKTTLLFLGDARNHEEDPRVDILKLVRDRCKNLIWVNPEPKVRWGTGDSDIYRYKPFCDLLEECHTLNQLEKVVEQLLQLSSRSG